MEMFDSMDHFRNKLGHELKAKDLNLARILKAHYTIIVYTTSSTTIYKNKTL